MFNVLPENGTSLSRVGESPFHSDSGPPCSIAVLTACRTCLYVSCSDCIFVRIISKGLITVTANTKMAQKTLKHTQEHFCIVGMDFILSIFANKVSVKQMNVM